MMTIAMRNPMVRWSFGIMLSRGAGLGRGIMFSFVTHTLAEVHTVIPTGEYLRWLPIEDTPAKLKS